MRARRSRRRRGGSASLAERRLARVTTGASGSSGRSRSSRRSLRTGVIDELARQGSLPLPDFRIGPYFIDALQRLQGIKQAKVADVVVEVVTDRAKDLPGRELHQYREADGGNAPGVRRSTDDAVMWRVNLQTNSASARRLHYWAMPGGEIELWHVGTHDERPPLA